MVPTKAQSRHVPISPEEISEQVKVVTEMGITSVHLHARSEDETPAWEKQYFERAISLIKEHSPDLVICVTTSGRTFTDFQKRADALEISGELKPDMASLTLASMNFATSASINSPSMVQDLATKMLEKEIKPELEIFDTGMINYAKYLITKKILKPPYIFNLLLGGIATAQAGLLDLGLMIERLPDESVWLAAGLGKSQLKANVMGLANGGGVRVGLEDNLHLDNKQQVLATNVQLVARVIDIGKTLGRSPMSPVEFRNRYLNA